MSQNDCFALAGCENETQKNRIATTITPYARALLHSLYRLIQSLYRRKVEQTQSIGGLGWQAACHKTTVSHLQAAKIKH